MRRHGNHQGIYQVPAKVRNFSFVLSQLRLIKNLQTVARNILSDKVRKTRFGRTDCPMDTRQLSSLVEAQRGPPARVWEDFTEAGGPSSGGKWGWREQESSINLRGYTLLPNLSLTQLWRRRVHTELGNTDQSMEAASGCFFYFFEVTQSCPTLCDSMDSSPPGFSIHGVFQARILEWVAISFSRGIFPTQGLNPGLLH